jgi:hypothetical protein
MRSEEQTMTQGVDHDYHVIWFMEQCLSSATRLEGYAEDADRQGDTALADFFRRAQRASEKGATQGKALLVERLRG